MMRNDRIRAWGARFRRSRRAVFGGVALLCGAALWLAVAWRPEARIAVDSAARPPAGLPVSVQRVTPEAHAAVISALGEVVPLWQTTIRAQVGGRIAYVSERLQEGNIVRRGERLAGVEPSDFLMQVAEAESRLAAARVALLKEEREAWEAKKNWQQSGLEGEPDSELVLRQPQLAAARAELAAARAALARAETLLGYTDIRAPFDGVIMRRAINRGETLFAGGEVVTLYGMETVEVGVHLDAAQWALLPEPLAAAGVRLRDPERPSGWPAEVARVSRHLSRDSRLRTVFLQVTQPLRQTPPLLPGAFVRADITGRSIPGLLCLPESALTRQGFVWFVDKDNRLRPWRLEPVFYGEGRVYVQAPDKLPPPLRVAVAPNASFTSGLAVQPLAAEKEAR